MKDMVITIDEAARCRMKFLKTNEQKRAYMFDAEYHAKVYEASFIVGKLLQIVRIRPGRRLRLVSESDEETRP